MVIEVLETAEPDKAVISAMDEFRKKRIPDCPGNFSFDKNAMQSRRMEDIMKKIIFSV